MSLTCQKLSPSIYIHSTSTSFHIPSVRTTNSRGTYIHTTWFQCILQSRGDDATNAPYSGIWHAGLYGNDQRKVQESSSKWGTPSHRDSSRRASSSCPVATTSTASPPFQVTVQTYSDSCGQTSNLIPEKPKALQTGQSFPPPWPTLPFTG